MTLKELVRNIKINEEWHNEYKIYVPKFIENAKKHLQWQDWEEEVFKQFFETSSGQCVASITQKYYTKKEQEDIKTYWNKIAPLLKEVAENQDTPKWDTYVKIYEEIFKLTKDNKKAATNRLIASLQPNLLCAIVTRNDIKCTFDLLSKYKLEGVPTYTNDKDKNMEWLKNSNGLLTYFKENLSTNSGYDICTLPWEIKKYLEKLDEKKEDPQKETDIKEPYTHPLNLILYGPPGTGKTYNTVNEALSIIEGKKIEELQKEDRGKVLERFNKYKEDGQIVFTTFHQSLSYEEFIEGIKPIPPDQQESYSIIAEHSSNASNPKFGNGRTVIENLPLMTYKVTDGIFSKVVKKAASTFYDNVSSNKVDFDDLWDQFCQKIKKGNTLKSKTGVNQTVADIKPHKIYFNKPDGTINTVNYVLSDKLKKLFEKFKDNYSNLQGFNDEFRNVIGGCNTTFYWTALHAICEFLKNEYKRDSELVLSDDIIFENLKIKDYIEKKGKPYVLIIDEINRGNVSQIFGELITLIEEDKRTTKWDKDKKQYVDNPEKITVKLPYSPDEEPFGVPGNLYIIGTMNTADRSVEALDTALRRRFEFKEMMPNSKIKDENGMMLFYDREICGVKLGKLMDTINERIRVLKDREHQIGHSYFMKCKTEDDLKNVFKNNIVPLLQEYFYGNYAYIGLVLGNRFVQKDEDANNPKFATFDGKDSFENNTDPQYKLLDEEGWEDLDMNDALRQLIGQ